MIRQRLTKTITANYTTTDADCGYRIICNSAAPITITLHTATGRTNFDLEIQNIGAGDVTCSGQTISQNAHVHVGNNGGATWTVVVGGSGSGVGNMKYRGCWSSGEDYDVNDVVYLINGQWLFICTESHTFTETVPYDSPKWDTLSSDLRWRGGWLSYEPYQVKDIVSYGGAMWLCIDSAYNTDPPSPTNNTKWSLMFEIPSGVVNSWDENRTYGNYDLCTYQGKIYTSLTSNNNSAPTEELFWSDITSTAGGIPMALNAIELYVGYAELLTGTVSVSNETKNQINGNGTLFTTELVANSYIRITGGGNKEIRTVLSISNNTLITLDSALINVYPAGSTVHVFKPGSDTNDGSAADAGHALATISEAISRLPIYSDYDCTVYIVPGDYMSQTLDLKGHLGAGWRCFYTTEDDWSLVTAYYTRIRDFDLYGCKCPIDIESLGFSYTVYTSNCSYVELWLLDIRKPVGFPYMSSIRAQNNSLVLAFECRLDHDTGIWARTGSKVYCEDITGSCSEYAVHLECGSSIHIEGTLPTAGTSSIFMDGQTVLVYGISSGTTAERPSWAPVNYCFVDTTLGKPIWKSSTGWIDATGTSV